MRRLSRSHPDLVLCCAAALAGGCGFDSSAKPGIDAGVDVPVGTVDAAPPDMVPGGTLCFGPAGWQVCLDAPPSGSITLSGTLDTDRSDAANPCLAHEVPSWRDALQPDACFIAGDKVGVTSLTVTGRRPLVIVGGSAITVTGLLDVGSRRAGPAGAAANSTECQPFKRAPGQGTGGGGGAGGSFGGQAGNGGEGNVGNRQNGQAADADVGDPARLRGGCPGQVGGNGQAGDAGNGGGAVYLVSGGAITIMGSIDASGAGGRGGAAQNGGSGGGSGGMIVLHGASIATLTSSLVFATGGGGGGGGAGGGAPEAAKGVDGHDPLVGLPLQIAAGGAGGQMTNASGGDGGDGFPAAGNSLDGNGGQQDAGGGGGGGASGFILANQSLGLAVVAPPPHVL